MKAVDGIRKSFKGYLNEQQPKKTPTQLDLIFSNAVPQCLWSRYILNR